MFKEIDQLVSPAGTMYELYVVVEVIVKIRNTERN